MHLSLNRIRQGLISFLALLPAIAPAQPASSPKPLLTPTVTQYSTLYLGDARLWAELKLTAEQKQKLGPVVFQAYIDFLDGRPPRSRF